MLAGAKVRHRAEAPVEALVRPGGNMASDDICGLTALIEANTLSSEEGCMASLPNWPKQKDMETADKLSQAAKISD
jgi:hypothetical protein